MNRWLRTTLQKQREQHNTNGAYHLAIQPKDHGSSGRKSPGRPLDLYSLLPDGAKPSTDCRFWTSAREGRNSPPRIGLPGWLTTLETVLLPALRVRQFSSRRLIRGMLRGCPCGRSSAKNAEFVCGRHELRGWPKFHKTKNHWVRQWNDEGRTRDSPVHFWWDGPKR